MRKPNHISNLKNIIHYAFDDLFESIWRFTVRRQNRFKLFEH